MNPGYTPASGAASVRRKATRCRIHIHAHSGVCFDTPAHTPTACAGYRTFTCLPGIGYIEVGVSQKVEVVCKQ